MVEDCTQHNIECIHITGQEKGFFPPSDRLIEGKYVRSAIRGASIAHENAITC